MATLDNAEQFSKAFSPIVSKSAPKVIDFKLVQFWKVHAPIDNSPPGSVTRERAVQPSKVYAPNAVTLSGIVLIFFSFPSNTKADERVISV